MELKLEFIKYCFYLSTQPETTFIEIITDKNKNIVNIKVDNGDVIEEYDIESIREAPLYQHIKPLIKKGVLE